ncbi:DNA polymerase/3'-5' exonuclease PolX [Oceanobacillus sp. J11TS1]|uniref:DNA polymerase/3'-5' exonuclease PolX n=1 Tax=Oceanobacillus sp. J11TS1 TaxID=2807191 RepID=UPI001B1405A1|nr:DNA polymerase/3'-5' exonuclease PolX [Oceanobacillus sp. J11TS1]GIO21742.1 DNA polymerase/3'-5' exonuclease PolX [Oceanobacillus sp. J11TS1]
MNKKDIIRLLEKIAVYMELKGENPFKISAYRKAAQAMETDDRSLSEIDDFTKIKGIGKGTAAVITEFMEAGRSETLEGLEKEVPAGLVPLLDLPGLGGKKLSKLYQELDVVDADTLKEACLAGTVEALPGFGKKSAEKIVAAIEEAGKRPERIPVAIMLPIVEKVEAYLDEVPGIIRYSQAGSIRRMRETVKDLDFIIATNQARQVTEALIKFPSIKNIIAKGDTKVSITLEEVYDINVDFRLVSDQEFASTLHHFTGSKDHNVAMRQLAKSRGEKISEYGVEVEETGETIQFDTETSFFEHFGLHFIPPEVRENTGEVEAFKKEQELIQLADIRGDLHMHTTWSDGAQSLDEMVSKVKDMGYSYMAITDHSKYLRVANGLNEERLRKQREEINTLNKKYPDFHIFSGVEMDILPDGSLDFDDDFLKEMDFVIGAIHSSFQQSEEKIMQRLMNALENPYVSIIAHPTGRLIGRRDGYKVNLEQLIEKAKETNTVLEINANPNRLDLSHEWAKKAQEAGVKLVIDTDSHNYQMLKHMQYGVATARKGWIKPSTVINTWPKEELIKFFSQAR